MRKTTRYLVRKGESMKMKVTRSNNISDINKFVELYDETAKLKNFIPHKSLKEEFEVFGKEKKAYLYFAEIDEKILSTALVVHYGKEAIYRHGATTLEGRNTPASYYLQWKAIK